MLDVLARIDAPAAALQPAPEVDVIDTFDAFEALAPAWRALQARDPEATVFLSWDWLAAAFRDNPRRWRIYVARDPDDLSRIVGLFPARLRVHWDRDRGEFTTELEAGGRLIYSPFCGFLCDPDWVEPALAAIAGAVAEAPWSELSLRYECSKARAAIFAAAFPETEFRLSWKRYLVDGGQTDNLLCPRIALPESYETYLQTLPDADTALSIRRFSRRFLRSGAWQLTRTGGADFARDLEILLGFWTGTRTAAKGAELAQRGAETYARILSLAQEMGCLHMAVLWSEGAPVGAVAHVLDHEMDRMHFMLAGQATEEGSVSLLLHAESIRWGIENGFACYDFGSGNAPYKYGFGARDTEVKYFALRRRMVPKTFGLDRLCLPDALARIEEMMSAGKVDRARQALEQVAKLV